MKFTKVFSLLLLLLICPSFAAYGAAESVVDKSGWPSHLRFLTGPNGGQWFMMGEPIADLLSKHVLPSTSRIGGGVANIASLNERMGDLGFSLSCFLGAGQSGEEEYKHLKTDNTVLLANVYPQVLYFLIRKEFAEKNGIKDVKTLLEADIPLRFATLKPGTASEFILNMVLKYGYGTTVEKLRAKGWTVSFNNYAEVADNFVTGEIDCFAYTAGTSVPLILTMEKHTEVIILPIEDSVLDIMAKKFSTSSYTIEPGNYKSITSPVTTLSDYTCIIVRKDLPDSLVYMINKTLWENRQKIIDIVVDFKGLTPKTALPQGLPVHPGSVLYWNELNKK